MITGREAWRLPRAAALGGVAVSVAGMILIGLCRPPAAVPTMDGAGLFPRLGWSPEPDLSVTVLLWASMIVGTLGTAAGLLALHRGWRPRSGPVLAGAAGAVVLLVAAPPMGTTDPMDYAAYGRMAVLGLNPHVTTPGDFRGTGDPVGVLAPREWEDIPSVYGPVATGAQWAASKLGGTSAARTVLWLKIMNGIAFLAVALCLNRLAGARRVRVHLLWTLNPLLLWALIGGAHVDGLAAALAVGGLAVLGPGTALRGRAGLVRAAAAGLLLGAAAGVKLPYVLVGAGMVWTLRRSPRCLAVLGAGAVAALTAGYAVVGPSAIEVVVRRGGMPSWNTPWQLVLSGSAPGWLTWGALALAVVAGAALLRLPTGAPPWPGPALAICLAWVITAPVYYPWYEALVFPLIALAPASRLDVLHLGRAFVATVAALPGVVCRLGDSWLRAAVLDGPVTSLAPVALLVLALLLVGGALARARVEAPAGRGAGRSVVTG
ncbi:polyprenol phosphomannose-dependent alpha 1,6 mannosyltransferase MptB [Actinomadura fibrosa]|uniref:Polyprenol phosphomannose-dependent alpha 1,6 mannosyltransferase MptB n=1 Tax=Actinomadura fibrosa TaxID=111802 RepID=A0ABW2XCM9_9ACTN|nr:polyprenol phosphomannose-dependent alpha 1,6 mannosyltransferase MptB [Actinomadura fibrosa]